MEEKKRRRGPKPKGRVRMEVTLPPALRDAAEAAAGRAHVSLSTWIEALILAKCGPVPSEAFVPMTHEQKRTFKGAKRR
jgi:hypothetical protein